MSTHLTTSILPPTPVPYTFGTYCIASAFVIMGILLIPSSTSCVKINYNVIDYKYIRCGFIGVKD